MLINYVAPEVIGFTSGVNQFVADYVKENPKRLLSCGSLHPRHTTNILADVEQLLRLGIQMIKIHPPHQLLFPNDYLTGMKELEIIYRAAEANGIPVMFHTGTSIFPGARNKYGDPIYIDDVAVDFPKLKILLAHGGRPLWMNTAFFLVRRHPNVYLDISGIPPKTLLKYFPRLQEIAHKTLFGTDWPGPGVPDIKQNLDELIGTPDSRWNDADLACLTWTVCHPEKVESLRSDDSQRRIYALRPASTRRKQVPHLFFLGLQIFFRVAAGSYFAGNPFDHLNPAALKCRNFVGII